MLEVKRTVLEAAGCTTIAKSADLATYDNRAAVSEMTARFGKLEQLLSLLEVRLGQLERRPAAPVDDEQIMAKASGGRERKRTPGEIKADLLSQIHAYCDSATTVGQLNARGR